MHLHLVISVIHLELHLTNDFNYSLLEMPNPVIVDDHKKYEIDAILSQCADQCLICWYGLSELTWEPICMICKDAPEVICKFQQAQHNCCC